MLAGASYGWRLRQITNLVKFFFDFALDSIDFLFLGNSSQNIVGRYHLVAVSLPGTSMFTAQVEHYLATT
jgi:hypothetical protein